MAAMGAILRDLEDELRKTIYALAPRQYGPVALATQFRMPKGADRAAFREQIGKSRLFNLTWGAPRQRTVGASSRTFTISGAITIGYPLNGTDIDRASDYQLICDALDSGGASTVTGVSFRLVNYEEGPDEEAGEDWIWMTIPLLAVIETT